jgi:cholesterol oxidase
MIPSTISRRGFLRASLATGATALGIGHAEIAAALGSYLGSAPAKQQATPALSALFYNMQVPELFNQMTQQPPAHTRNLVIGSGFGGAISALRLAQAGEPVTLLERGFKWPNAPWRNIFSNETLPDGRAFWFKNQVTMLTGFEAKMDYFGGVMDATEYDDMTVWRGACVGGGSVIFTGVMIQPDQYYFDALFQGRVSYAELDRVYYPRVRSMLNLSAMPNDVYQSAPFGHSRVWDEQARMAGYSPTPIDSMFNWSVIRSELAGTVRKSATIGLSNHGNSNGAKFDLNQNYLSLAEATGLAKVYPGREVQGIGWDGSRYQVDVISRSVSGEVLQRATLTCDRLFLAAGSIGTSELLVKARAEGTLANLNEHIGQGWGTNGDAIVVRSYGDVEGFTQGTPSASRIHDTSQMPVTFENWYAPGVPVDVGIIGSLGMAFDETNRGQFAWNSSTGKVDLQWAEDGNAEAHAAMSAVNEHIASSSNTKTGIWPIIGSVSGKNWTAHPLGGAVLGLATDNYGRVKGHPGLYVMDGAGIPGSTCSVNPSLTISALAERNIEHIIATGE